METLIANEVAPRPKPPSASGPEVVEVGSMRAIVHHRYGSPENLEFCVVKRPTVGDRDVLIRVHAASANKGDWHILTGRPYLLRLAGYGLLKPRNGVFGQELAGHVEAVGRSVTKFQRGDEVFGEVTSGAFADYACAPEDRIAHKPAGLSFAAAAALPSSGLAALQALRDVARLRPGQSVLINGASGGVGSFAVQLAKFYGAVVTGICSTRNIEMVRSLGADHVIDYTGTDFSRSGEVHDVMLDLVGNRSLADCRRAITSAGVYVACAGDGGDWLGPLPRMVRMAILSGMGSQRLASFVAKTNPMDLAFLAERLEAGDIAPLISERWSLNEAPEALRVLGTGRARGKMILHRISQL